MTQIQESTRCGDNRLKGGSPPFFSNGVLKVIPYGNELCEYLILAGLILITMNDLMLEKIHAVLSACIGSLKWFEEERRGLSDYDWMNSVNCISIYAKELQEVADEYRKEIQEEE